MDNSKTPVKIKIEELIAEYNKRNSTKLKYEYLKSVIKIVDYVGYGEKMFLAENIVNICCLKDNNVNLDSCKKYILYIYTILSRYTNLDIKEEDLLIQYDLLDQYGLIDEILGMIPEKEIVSFKTILDMKQNDLIANRYEIHSYITNKINSLYPEISKAIIPLIEKLSKKIESLDEKKLERFFNKVTK